jgi:hypothetical protein
MIHFTGKLTCRFVSSPVILAWLICSPFGSRLASARSSTDWAGATTNGVAAGATREPAEPSWSLGASAYTYIVPDSREYFQPTLTVDHGWFHTEARYNYENLETASVWLGYNFSGGGKLSWEFTPMLGGVFGNTTGIATGYKGSIGWWKLELYSEGEYVVDVEDSSGSFFYNWSELALSPLDWLRFGIVTQRTRLYETDRDIQRGVLVGFNYKRADFTAYVLNPDESSPTVVLAVAFGF